MNNPIADLDVVATLLHSVGITDRMRALSRGEFLDYEDAVADEPEPKPATWDDVELIKLGLVAWAERIRDSIQAHGSAWRTPIIEHWEKIASELESKWSAHRQSAEHERWLAENGPMHLWETLNARKQSSLRRADAVHSVKGDARAFEDAANLAAWQMDEMVRLFLQEAAQ